MSRLALVPLAAVIICLTQSPSPAAADPVSQRAEALALVSDGNWSDAAQAYERLSSNNPDRGDDAYFLGLALAKSGQCQRAIPVLARAIELGATGSAASLRRAHYEAAACAAETGDRASALAHLSAAQGRLGFAGMDAAGEDPRFGALAQDPAFRQLAGLTDETDRVRGWRGDLAWWVELVGRRHPQPFHAVAEPEWRRAVAQLDADIPTLSDLQITARLMRLAALIGDGHTSVYPPFEGPRSFHLLPIWPYRIGDDWYVMGASPGHTDLVGGRIVSVGGRPAAEVADNLSAMLPKDNDWSGRWIAAVGFQFAETATLAARPDGSGPLDIEVETPAGGRRTEALDAGPIDRNPLSAWTPAGWPWMGDAAPLPLWLSRTSEPWWFQDIDAPRAVYVQVNQVSEAEPGDFERFAVRLAEHMRADPSRPMILDLRHNNGGNGALNWTLARELVRCGCDRPGGIFVITGRRTFSAAMTLSSLLETRTEALFVGEPTGSRPNFYGEDTLFSLPWSGLKGSISSAWFQGGETSFDQRPAIAPDLRAELTVDDVVLGRDPALAAIAAYLAQAR